MPSTRQDETRPTARQSPVSIPGPTGGPSHDPDRSFGKSASRLMYAAAHKASALESRYGPNAVAVMGRAAASAKGKIDRQARSYKNLVGLATTSASANADRGMALDGGSQRRMSTMPKAQEKWTIFRTWARWIPGKNGRQIELRIHGWIYEQRAVDDLHDGLSSSNTSELGFSRKQRMLLALIKRYSLPKGRQDAEARTKGSHRSTRMPGSFPPPLAEKEPILTEEPGSMDPSDGAGSGTKTTSMSMPALGVDTGQSSLSSSAPRHGSSLLPPFPQSSSKIDQATAERMHQNLLHRIRPFLSKPSIGRCMEISVELSTSQSPRSRLLREQIVSGQDGHFTKTLCIDLGDADETPHSLQLFVQPLSRTKSDTDLAATAAVQMQADRTGIRSQGRALRGEAAVTITSLELPIVNSDGVRVISDIDDTVRQTFVKFGSRQVIRQLFMNDITIDSAVPGVSQAFRRLEAEGVRFHYVSNSPWELSASIDEFFKVTGLPLGSSSLRAYSGMGMANIWTNAADRKRSSVLDVLDTFKQSRFVLFGDSGEMDLELYTSIAIDRPSQIIAIFIRDVSTTSPKDWTDSPSEDSRSTTPPSGQAAMSESPFGKDKDKSEVQGHLSSIVPASVDDLGARTSMLTLEPLDASTITGCSIESSPTMTPNLLTSPASASLNPQRLARRLKRFQKADKTESFNRRLARSRSQLPNGIPVRVWRVGSDFIEECMSLIQQA